MPRGFTKTWVQKGRARDKARDKELSLKNPFENYGGSVPNIAEQEYVYDFFYINRNFVSRKLDYLK